MKRLILATLCSLAVTAETVTIEVEGMTCPLCTAAIKHSLKKVEGVSSAKVKLSSKRATVTYQGKVTGAQLLEAVKKAGYQGKILKEVK